MVLPVGKIGLHGAPSEEQARGVVVVADGALDAPVQWGEQQCLACGALVALVDLVAFSHR